MTSPTSEQERAEAFLGESFPTVLVSAVNEQGNVLMIGMEPHPQTEAGREIMRVIVRPNGFVFFASYTEGNKELFDAVMDGYYRIMPARA